ncbi:SDR family oxidoreductase [Solirubrum puertoriconensis]|uniref:dTDP-4-dehydrorhamnose reductase n=1 Tax=Solirubrum puertoriconensis TaxID=1751427 RepID=A0A9X0L3L0_SOLP1|nr:SDR family oxidoreductase [Solirubrum puertoriconensis]KUG06606.1 NAD(P)-dependent oxidoreductase [Solirubrum puertoriconensis]
MRLLITGANGLLGQKLIGLLHQEPSVELIATSRGSNRLGEVFPNVPFSALDVTNAEQVEQVIGELKPTHVIHTAAMTNVDECELNHEACWLQNVTATENLARTCAAHDVHLTHLSTDFIFDGSHGPLTEDATPNPISYYGQSKLAAEQAVQNTANLRWAIARTVLVYGVLHGGGRTNIVLWVRNSLREGKQIKVVNDQWRTPTLAEDLAQGCWLIAKQSARGIFNISGRELLTPYDIALRVADHFSLDKSLIIEADGSTFTQPAKRPPRTGFIIEKAEKELGYRPHSFTEGIDIVAAQA